MCRNNIDKNLFILKITEQRLVGMLKGYVWRTIIILKIQVALRPNIIFQTTLNTMLKYTLKLIVNFPKKVRGSFDQVPPSDITWHEIMILEKPIFSFISNDFNAKPIYENFTLISYSKNNIITYLLCPKYVSEVLYLVWNYWKI